VAPSTPLNPNLLAAFDEDPSKARLDVLRNRLVTGRADYPEKLQNQLLSGNTKHD
jgi:hypothetical protein